MDDEQKDGVIARYDDRVMRTAMDPRPGDKIAATDGSGFVRYVTRTEMAGRAIYYSDKPNGPEVRKSSTWITSWRNWVRKRQAEIVAVTVKS